MAGAGVRFGWRRRAVQEDVLASLCCSGARSGTFGRYLATTNSSHSLMSSTEPILSRAFRHLGCEKKMVVDGGPRACSSLQLPNVVRSPRCCSEIPSRVQFEPPPVVFGFGT